MPQMQQSVLKPGKLLLRQSVIPFASIGLFFGHSALYDWKLESTMPVALVKVVEGRTARPIQALCSSFLVLFTF